MICLLGFLCILYYPFENYLVVLLVLLTWRLAVSVNWGLVKFSMAPTIFAECPRTECVSCHCKPRYRVGGILSRSIRASVVHELPMHGLFC